MSVDPASGCSNEAPLPPLGPPQPASDHRLHDLASLSFEAVAYYNATVPIEDRTGDSRLEFDHNYSTDDFSYDDRATDDGATYDCPSDDRSSDDSAAHDSSAGNSANGDGLVLRQHDECRPGPVHGRHGEYHVERAECFGTGHQVLQDDNKHGLR